MVSCYFCDSIVLEKSAGQRSIIFENVIHDYHLCNFCGGFSMYPKLRPDQLNRMYSSDYVGQNVPSIQETDGINERKFVSLVKFFDNNVDRNFENFLDYGCGADPVTFEFARNVGLVPYGMELVREVRELAQNNRGAQIYSRKGVLSHENFFDIIFLGDVLEHLVDPIYELQQLKSTLKQGGVIIAQGPLQGSATFMQLTVRFFARLTSSKFSTYPPYHVSLATVKSMESLVAVAGLKLNYIDVDEVFWPAPVFVEVFRNPSLRNIILYVTKRIDIAMSLLLPRFGTRYFLVCSQ